MNNLLKLLWKDPNNDPQFSIQSIPHIIMYLSLKLDSDTSKDEVSICTSKISGKEPSFYLS